MKRQSRPASAAARRQRSQLGAKGEIKVGFNSAGKLNKQNKTLPIISNSVNDAAITFTTTVITKEINN